MDKRHSIVSICTQRISSCFGKITLVEIHSVLIFISVYKVLLLAMSGRNYKSGSEKRKAKTGREKYISKLPSVTKYFSTPNEQISQGE